MSDFEPSGASGAAGGGPVRELARLATYNVHSGVGADGKYDVDRLAAVIGGLGADLVALQEVEVNTAAQRTRVWSVEHDHHQPREIAERAGFPHHTFAPAIPRCRASSRGWLPSETHAEGEGAFGIAIISKLPLLDSRELQYALYGSKSPRNAVAVLVELCGRATWVVCTHLGCHFGPEQAAQMRELLPWVDALGGDSVVVMGDLNSPPMFEAARMLFAHRRPDGRPLIDAWAEAGRWAPCPSYPVSWWAPAVLRLDYVAYAAEHMDVESADTVHSLASDHRALVVVFRLSPSSLPPSLPPSRLSPASLAK